MRMANEILQEIACPNCRNPIDVREHGRHVTCAACSSHFILRGHLCPNCGTYHAVEKPFCGACGTAMERICRNCNTNNWTGDEYCSRCGRAMDIFEVLALLHKDARREYMARRLAEIRSLREQEEIASEKRMEELEAQATEHWDRLQRRMAEKREKEKRTLRLTLGAVALFFLIILTYTLVSLLAA